MRGNLCEGAGSRSVQNTSRHKMWRVTAVVLVSVTTWSLACCSLACPDGKLCPESSTCCKSHTGYECCQYPKAVCCSDLSHCCPEGYSCNLDRQMCEREYKPWFNAPMMKKVAAKEPSVPLLRISPLPESKNTIVADGGESSVVYCDNYYYCPDGTTCCRHPAGAWFCCQYSPGWCCLDGYHCCPYGYVCDLTYTHCVRRGVMYPFLQKISTPASKISTTEDKVALQEMPMTPLTESISGASEPGVIRCNDQFYCPTGQSCCTGPTGKLSCCPYPLGQCCIDGVHCCEYGYSCGPKSLTCRKWKAYTQIPSGPKEPAKQD